MTIIRTVGRKLGAADISWGDGTFNFVDENGVSHQMSQVGAAVIPMGSSYVEPMINSKEPAIAAGSAGQYWRGDKTWQTHNASSVGLVPLSTDTLMTASSDALIPSQKATKVYVDAAMTGAITTSQAYTDARANKFLQQVCQIVGTVSTGTAQIPYDDTIPEITEGSEFLNRAITPVNSGSQLQIDVNVYWAYENGGGYQLAAALFQDSTTYAISVGGVTVPGNSYLCNTRLNHVMTAGTTGSTTFTVRIGGNAAGTITLNGVLGARKYGGRLESSIVITEYTP